MGSRYKPFEDEVPENKLGLRTHTALAAIETPLALRRLLELQQHPLIGSFDT
jgi:hypothetical protein